MTVIATIDPRYVKVRWNERYVSEAVNQQAGAHPAGCYRGLHLTPTAPATKVVTLEQVNPWGVDEGEHFAVVASRAGGWAVAVRDVGSISLDLTGAFLVRLLPDVLLYVYLTADYTAGVATHAEWQYQWTTDPRVADPSAVVIGVLQVPVAAIALDFDPEPGALIPGGTVLSDWTARTTDTLRAAADHVRTRPTPVILNGEWDAVTTGDRWGLMSGAERQLIPVANQKAALNAAAAPSGANAVATMADVNALGAKVVGEPQRLNIDIIAGAVELDMFTGGAAQGVYVGTGNAASALGWFDVHAESASTALVCGDGSLIRVTAVQKVDPGGIVTTLTPSVDADANGFWAPPALALGDYYLRLVLTQDVPSATPPAKAAVWLTIRATLAAWADTPAVALPMAARARLGHAAETAVQQYLTPPGTPVSADGATVQDAVRRLQVVTRGTVGQAATDIQVAAGSFWQGTSPDQPEATAWATGNWAALIDPDIDGERNFLAAGVAGNRRVIGIVARPGAVNGAAVVVGDTTTREVIWDGTGTQLPGFVANDVVVAVASDAVRLYVRVWNTVTFVHTVHAFWWTALADGTPLVSLAWSRALGTSDVAFGNPYYDPISTNTTTYVGFANQVSVVGPNTVAANLPWNDLIGGGGADGIRLINATTGATVGAMGAGDILGAGTWYSAVGPIYACGPICGDGVNVFFCAKSVAAPDVDVTYVASCKISNATLSNYGAWPDAQRMFGFVGASVGNHGREGRGLVYDGAYLWASAGNGIWCGVPGGRGFPLVPANNASSTTWDYQWTLATTTLDSIVGPVVTDGRFAYVAVMGNVADGHMRLWRLGAQGIPADGLAGVFFTALVDRQWALAEPIAVLGFGPWDPAFSHVGPALFDGDNVWAGCSANHLLAAVESQIVHRVPLVRGW